MALNKQAGQQNGKSSKTPSIGLFLPSDLPGQHNTKMYAPWVRTILSKLTALPPDSLVKTSASWVQPENPGLMAWLDKGAVYFGKSSVSSAKFSPLGWYLKTSRTCSLSMIAKTFRQSSQPLPNAGMWDISGCSMLNISESPKTAAAFSWSQVLDATPAPRFWLTPEQWRQYLLRLAKSNSHGTRIATLPILIQPKTQLGGLVWAVRFSLLKRTDGVRWLSGAESLAYMGFPRDWITATFTNATQPETPSSPPWRDGLPKR